MAILDASAALAAILREPGSDFVIASLPARLSAVTLAETRAKLLLRGFSIEKTDRSLSRLGAVVPFTREIAIVAGDLISRFRQYDFSLGDCCCLATGIVLDEPVLTSDRDWAKHDTGADGRLFR